MAGGGGIDRGKPLVIGSGHDVDDAASADLLLEGDIEVNSHPPHPTCPGENPSLWTGRRRRTGVVFLLGGVALVHRGR
jgi:hypothetical protein